MAPLSSGESLPFASERPDMTVLAKEMTARLAASFEVRIFPHGGASASVSIMKRTDGPKQFSKLHIFTQMNPLCRQIFSSCRKIMSSFRQRFPLMSKWSVWMVSPKCFPAKTEAAVF